jgi:mycothiol synthase
MPVASTPPPPPPSLLDTQSLAHRIRRGLGLGKQLTLAGLEHLAGQGITTALLYVDADNAAAVTMYERLGFTVSATNAAFVTDVAPSSIPVPDTRGAC